MRRRRQKNSLLPKMLGVALLINAILLPILARLGVFKNIGGRHLDQVQLVKLPPPERKPAQPKRAPPKRRVAKAKPRAAAQRAAGARPSRLNPNQPKVVASSGAAGGAGGGIDNSGTETPGQVTPPPPTPAPDVVPAPVTAPPPVAPPPAPVTAPPPVAPPAPLAVLPPHEPVVVAAEPLSQRQPRIPGDLSFDDIHSDFEALFSVKADGSVTVNMVASTGDPRLDELALDAARHWTFRAATVDGRPVDSFRRLLIQFYAA